MTTPQRSPRPEQVESFDDVGSLHVAVEDAFCGLVTRSVEERGIANISLSGGSTPKRLYELLASRDLPWDKIHWFWGDERNVPRDDDQSNQKMVRNAMLTKAGVPESNIHAVPVDPEHPQRVAEQYETLLREHFTEEAFPQWDLVLLGMGDDAHTASLFPGTTALQEEQRWFVENWVEKFDSFRYTLTVPAIRSARESWFLVSGSGKQDALRAVWRGPESPLDYPSQLISATRWYVTADALPAT